MGKKTMKSPNRCSFKGKTVKQCKNPKLAKSFDLAKLVYEKPIRKDLAVCLVYFNSSKSKRLLMNYLYTVEKLKVANIPVFTLEMYKDSPEIADAFHVKTDFILFQKEQLCYLLEKRVPKSFSKLLFMDCDVIFDNLNWYNELSSKLNVYNIIQPFSKARWLDITYKKVVKERVPIVFFKHFGKINNAGGIGGYHPGFAWGFQRKWYNEIGFFRYAILGCGDSISSTTILNFPWFKIRPYFQKAVEEYRNLLKEPPSVCYLNGILYHLWHGDSKNRQYSSRREIFDGVDDIRDILKVERNGLFALKDDSLKKPIEKYFANRQDDGLANGV